LRGAKDWYGNDDWDAGHQWGDKKKALPLG